jgi:TPP-dependent 2-oxoacid decarboxylase
MHGVKVGGAKARYRCNEWLKEILEDDILALVEERIQIVTNIINYLKMSETLTKQIRKKQRKRPKSGSKKPKKKKPKKKKSKKKKSKKKKTKKKTK